MTEPSFGEKERLYIETEERYVNSSGDESEWKFLDSDGCAAGELRHAPCLNRMRIVRMYEKAKILESAKAAEHIDTTPVDIGEMFR